MNQFLIIRQRQKLNHDRCLPSDDAAIVFINPIEAIACIIVVQLGGPSELQ